MHESCGRGMDGPVAIGSRPCLFDINLLFYPVGEKYKSSPAKRSWLFILILLF